MMWRMKTRASLALLLPAAAGPAGRLGAQAQHKPVADVGRQPPDDVAAHLAALLRGAGVFTYSIRVDEYALGAGRTVAGCPRADAACAAPA